MINTTNRRLRFVLRGCAAVSVVVLGLGCKSITNNVETAELAGFWVASQMQFADPANLNQTADAIALGFAMTLDVNANGAYTRVITPPNELPDSATGTLTVENGKDITMNNTDGYVAEGEVFLEDDQVSLLFDESQGLTADIDDKGPKAVTLLAVMDRQQQ